MKTAIVLHGMYDKKAYYNPKIPSGSNDHWLPWLQKQLLVLDIAAQTPELPEPYAPDYELWRREFERYDIHDDTILVGHSCGGGFLVRWLSENKDVRVGKVVLVAPWLDPKRKSTGDFFEFDIDPGIVRRTAGITIFNSDNDGGEVQVSVARLRETIADIGYREFTGYKHFTRGVMGTDKFPELLDECLAVN